MSLISKIFGSAVLAAFEEEILTAKVGQPVLGGHATVVSVEPHKTVVELKFGSLDYNLTIERKLDDDNQDGS